MASTTKPDLSISVNGVPGSALLSPSLSTPAGKKIPVEGLPWRPNSVPQISTSRTSSPFLGLWSKKQHHHHHHHHHQLQRQPQDDSLRTKLDADADAGPDPAMTAKVKRTRNQGTAVETHVSSHEGRISTTPDGYGPKMPPTNAFELSREEFEALPLAIQRKYFSTLERLRFARDTTDVDGIYNHYGDITALRSKRRKHGSKRNLPDPHVALDVPATTGSSNSPCPCAVNHPQLAQKTQLSREEQCELVKHLRASVILDAADEAYSNLCRKTSSRSHLIPTPDMDKDSTSTLSTRRDSLDSMTDVMAQSEANAKADPARQSLYKSFRWLDEEEDLDLKLFLDDYHANLREELPKASKNLRPTFRRHLSISNLPFGRPSLSSSRPDRRDGSVVAPASPLHSPSLSQPASGTTALKPCRTSRTLSLIDESTCIRPNLATAGIDPAAAHYQDPEARLKLRVYLASPQRFDEAVEFGFPALDAVQAPMPLSHRLSMLRRRQSRPKLHSDPDDHMRSFLDEDLSDNGDEEDDASSVPDLESPRTPQLGGLTHPPVHHGSLRVSTDPLHHSPPTHRAAVPRRDMSTNDSYAHVSAHSREMTLRMTLTRPDLRVDDELIYEQQRQLSCSASKGAHARVHEQTAESILVGVDTHICGPDSSAAGSDGGIMKRILNRVRRA